MIDAGDNKENYNDDHGLKCVCSGCGGVAGLSFKTISETAGLQVGDKFNHGCPDCGIVEHILKLTEKERMDAAFKYPGPKDFVHLHNHTIYSSLDGVAKPDEYFDGCVECSLPAFAITDHGSMASIPDAFFAAKKRKIKFIPGCEIYFNDFETEFRSWREQGKSGKIDDNMGLPELSGNLTMNNLKMNAQPLWSRFQRNRHLTVIAKNEIGFKNLVDIQNKAWEQGFYYKPRVSYKLLQEHKEGLIVISGCLNGPLSHELRSPFPSAPTSSTIRKRLDGTTKLDDKGYASPKRIAIEWVKQFREDFGDDYYLELQMPGESIPNGKLAFRLTAELGRQLDIKCVVTNDCHYTNRDDFKIQMVMMAVAQDKKIDDPTLFHVNSDEQFFKTRAQLRKSFIENKYTDYASMDEFEEYCDNTVDIAEKCSNFSPDLDPKLPEVGDANKALIKAAWFGLKEKGLSDKPEYVNRMKLELKRFIDKEFSSYFLITSDICVQSRNEGWPLGPARGSAGGSLVCYVLGIHDMDPLQWDLSFDRFLSESRGGYMLNATM